MSDPDFDRVLHEVTGFMQKGVTTAKQLTEAQDHNVVAHDGTFRLCWDLGTLVLVMFSCIFIPLRIAFEADVEGDDIKTWQIADIVIDAIFMLDVCLNFNTSYTFDGLRVTSRCLIAKNYLSR